MPTKLLAPFKICPIIDAFDFDNWPAHEKKRILIIQRETLARNVKFISYVLSYLQFFLLINIISEMAIVQIQKVNIKKGYLLIHHYSWYLLLENCEVSQISKQKYQCICLFM